MHGEFNKTRAGKEKGFKRECSLSKALKNQ